MELYLETFDLKTMLEDVVATTRLLVQKKSNKLEVRLSPDLGTMRADLTKVRQALFNLLSNASKFTEHGTITLEAAREAGSGGGDWIVLQSERHRHRHDARAVEPACSRPSRRRTLPRCANTAARDWAWPSRDISAG